MANIIIKRTDRDALSRAGVPEHYRGRVSGTARSYEEADEIVRRHDRSAVGGPRLAPLIVTDTRENERVQIEGHAKAIPEARAEEVVMAPKPKKRTYFT